MERVRISYTVPTFRVKSITHELLEYCRDITETVSVDVGSLLQNYEEKDLNIIIERIDTILDNVSLSFEQMKDVKDLLTGYRMHLLQKEDVKTPDGEINLDDTGF